MTIPEVNSVCCVLTMHPSAAFALGYVSQETGYIGK